VAAPSWAERAHEGQLEPEGEHATWLILAGRGFGKTRAGAEWVAGKVREGPGPQRIALVGATLEEARDVMVLGDSGLLAVAADIIQKWLPSRGELHFTDGSIAKLFSGANPERLRGFQHHFAWCDEIAKWKKGMATWDNLQFGLRLGEDPRTMVTTTPAASEVLEWILGDEETVVTRGTTFDNPHLPASFLKRMKRRYDGTRIGLVELYGEMPPPAGALWSPELIAASRTEAPLPAFDNLVIGVDPPAGDGVCGIVACGRDEEGRFHVIADHSLGEASPSAWSGRVAAAAQSYDGLMEDGRCVEIVAEGNQGGSMVRDVLQKQDAALAIDLVHASVGKSARAEPIAMLFESGRVQLHGRFPELERELCGLIAGGGYQGPGTSPDRADAMVWALTKLSGRLGNRGPRVSSI
jgi:phage terminase large subunit-like protein